MACCLCWDTLICAAKNKIKLLSIMICINLYFVIITAISVSDNYITVRDSDTIKMMCGFSLLIDLLTIVISFLMIIHTIATGEIREGETVISYLFFPGIGSVLLNILPTAFFLKDIYNQGGISSIPTVVLIMYLSLAIYVFTYLALTLISIVVFFVKLFFVTLDRRLYLNRQTV